MDKKNEKITELTPEQMEKVNGGRTSDDRQWRKSRQR